MAPTWLAALFLVLCPNASAGQANQTMRGPVEAIVLSVTDGDTLYAEARIWPGHSVRVLLRLRGVDAPELKGRCPAERAAAQHARLSLETLIGDGAIAISNIGGGKYYGRVLADVETAAGVAVGPSLLARGLVRSYSGGRRGSWCG